MCKPKSQRYRLLGALAAKSCHEVCSAKLLATSTRSDLCDFSVRVTTCGVLCVVRDVLCVVCGVYVCIYV